MRNIKISRKAISDLDNIWEYTVKTWSEQQADKYYKQLTVCIQSLSDLPEYMEREYDAVKPGLLGLHIGHHIIFYNKRKDGSIWIDRILHETMDFNRHF
jgi:toxin ParE1/3/4